MRILPDRRLAVLVRESHERSRKTNGSPRVLADLDAQGERVSRKRIIRLMQQQGLQARVRRRAQSSGSASASALARRKRFGRPA
jgi:hypothetical protein